MKRVLIVISTGMDQYGGLTNAIMNYIRAMNMDDLLVSFASYRTEDTPQETLLIELKELGCDFIELPDRKSMPLKYMESVYKLSKGYDCIHVNANSATALLELLPAYLAHTKKRLAHNHTARCDHYVIHSLLYPIFRRLYTNAIAVSNKAGDWIFGKSNFVVLKNGVNVEKYRYSIEDREKVRKLYGIPYNAKVIGHLGKIYEPKNHVLLIEVFEYICHYSDGDDLYLLLVGDGELREKIEEMVTNKGLQDRVIFAGMQKNVKEYLNAMDVFVFPSLWEGLPISLLEAQASGLPCVISDRIDNEVCTSDLVKRISLDAGLEKWKDAIFHFFNRNREKDSFYEAECLKEKGFDTVQSANLLRQIYIE